MKLRKPTGNYYPTEDLSQITKGDIYVTELLKSIRQKDAEIERLSRDNAELREKMSHALDGRIKEPPCFNCAALQARIRELEVLEDAACKVSIERWKRYERRIKELEGALSLMLHLYDTEDYYNDKAADECRQALGKP